VRALPGEAVIANRDFVSPPLPLADQPGSALQLRAASYSGLSDFLQIPSDLGKLPLGLWAQTAQRKFLHRYATARISSSRLRCGEAST